MCIVTQVVPVMLSGEADVDVSDAEGEVQALNDVQQRGEVRVGTYLTAAITDGSVIFGFKAAGG